jgi:hypothetical protein
MKNTSKIFFSLILLLSPFLTEAQCAVCAAGAASTARTNGSYGAGINSGIIYMLTITYLVFAIAGIYFLRHRIRYYVRTLATRWRMFIASF